jgi:FtsZ-binding cell division protein ZapB
MVISGLDPWTVYPTILSLLLLGATILTARWALLGFKQSKRALREATSYVSVIVSALSPRIESLEAAVNQLRDAIAVQGAESANLQSSEMTLQSKFQGVAKSVEELAAQRKQMVQELDQFRSRFAMPLPPTLSSPVTQPPTPLQDPVVDRLTPTERHTLEILAGGPLPAPELGRRLNKSREHMARLMKRLYLEGYVDRDADRPPFRYKLNDKLRASLGDVVNEIGRASCRERVFGLV